MCGQLMFNSFGLVLNGLNGSLCVYYNVYDLVYSCVHADSNNDERLLRRRKSEDRPKP